MDKREKESRPVFIGSSSCLLGESVRWDGGDKREEILADRLAGELQIIPVCPEMDLGLGSPREPMNLYRDDEGALSLRTTETDRDLTGRMKDYIRLRISELKGDHLRGFVLKSGSPSCGMEKIPIYRGRGDAVADGPGMFAAELIDAFPGLPIIEESGIRSFPALYQFLVRVYTYDRWRILVESGMRADLLEQFHKDHQLLVEASKPGSWGGLENLGGDPNEELSSHVVQEYEKRLMIILSHIPSHESHAEVLFKIAFSIEKRATEQVMGGVITAVDDYRSDRLSLVGVKEIVGKLWACHGEDAPPGAAAYLNPIPRTLADSIV